MWLLCKDSLLFWGCFLSGGITEKGEQICGNMALIKLQGFKTGLVSCGLAMNLYLGEDICLPTSRLGLVSYLEVKSGKEECLLKLPLIECLSLLEILQVLVVGKNLHPCAPLR